MTAICHDLQQRIFVIPYTGLRHQTTYSKCSR